MAYKDGVNLKFGSGKYKGEHVTYIFYVMPNEGSTTAGTLWAEELEPEEGKIVGEPWMCQEETADGLIPLQVVGGYDTTQTMEDKWVLIAFVAGGNVPMTWLSDDCRIWKRPTASQNN